MKSRLILIPLYNNTFKLFCSYAGIIGWLQNNLLPCPFKKLTGWDCPLCGLQRSVLALLNGDLIKSLQFFPATIPLLIAVALGIPAIRSRVQPGPVLMKTVYVVTGLVIAGNYGFKMSLLLIK